MIDQKLLGQYFELCKEIDEASISDYNINIKHIYIIIAIISIVCILLFKI